MKNLTRMILSLAAVSSVGGCSTFGDALGSAVIDAPEWFQARREEVRGDGYPKLKDMPANPDMAAFSASAEAEKNELLAFLAELDKDPNAQTLTDKADRETPEAWASRIREELNKVSPPEPEVNSDSETDADTGAVSAEIY